MRCVTYCKYRDIIFVPVHLNTIEENKIFQNKEIYKYTTEVTVCVISPLVTKVFFFIYINIPEWKEVTRNRVLTHRHKKKRKRNDHIWNSPGFPCSKCQVIGSVSHHAKSPRGAAEGTRCRQKVPPEKSRCDF